MTTNKTPPNNGGADRPPEQYILPLPHETALTRADFIAAPANREALDWIERWPDWPAPALTLSGPAGAGKTHLAQIWRAHARANEIDAAALANAAVPILLGDARTALIDAADGAAEEPLLHLYNMIAERGGHLLLLARVPPSRWNIALADLRSRLLACPSVAVAAPDDALIASVLIKLFADRKLSASPDLVSFLLLRMERSFAAAQDAVARLDRAAMAEHRAITVPLARKVLFGEES